MGTIVFALALPQILGGQFWKHTTGMDRLPGRGNFSLHNMFNPLMYAGKKLPPAGADLDGLLPYANGVD